MAAVNPERMTILKIGESYEGRDLKVVKISSKKAVKFFLKI